MRCIFSENTMLWNYLATLHHHLLVEFHVSYPNIVRSEQILFKATAPYLAFG